MARRELGIWRRLDHPNVVPFLGITTGFGMSGSTSLVSEWMRNGTLGRFLEEYENLGMDHRLRLPIVHGDLNPANVLLDENYTARLVDFGYASMVGEMPEALRYLRRTTRQPGAMRWIAPEQVSSTLDVVDRTTQSDVYSFGCIALQASLSDIAFVLSGKPPWSELGEDVAVLHHLSEGKTPCRPASRPIDDQHWELIKRCLLPILNRPAINTIVPDIKRFWGASPRSEPLRDVIALLSSQNSQQSNVSHSVYFFHVFWRRRFQ
ncbi:kinase-like domain-containing protein [Boletus coccyginus]|nr:kinase-like domain-containing protein [Boletus coccyginus]